MIEPVTVHLLRPVEVFGQRYSALTIRAPTKADLKAIAPGFEVEVGLNLAALLTGVPVTVILAMSDDDVQRVGIAVRDLLDRSGII